MCFFYLQFHFSSRFTEADAKNDIRSVYRCLDKKLFLIVKKNRNDHAWQFPQGSLLPDELLKAVCSSVFPTSYLFSYSLTRLPWLVLLMSFYLFFREQSVCSSRNAIQVKYIFSKGELIWDGDFSRLRESVQNEGKVTILY
jgi:hypothetical protein